MVVMMVMQMMMMTVLLLLQPTKCSALNEGEDYFGEQ